MSKSILALQSALVLPFGILIVAIAGCPNTETTVPTNGNGGEGQASATSNTGPTSTTSSSTTSSTGSAGGTSISSGGSGGAGGSSTSSGGAGGTTAATGSGGAATATASASSATSSSSATSTTSSSVTTTGSGGSVCGAGCSNGEICTTSGCAYATSCLDLVHKTGASTLPDSDYTLQPAGGKPLLVYCSGLGTTAPKEYLTLQHTYAKGYLTSNFSGFFSPGCQCNGDITRHFEKVRIDLTTLIVDITDGTFTTNTSSDLPCWTAWATGTGGCETGVVLPYAYGGDCEETSITEPGDIDLHGLSVSIDPSVTFGPIGSNHFGTGPVSADRKQVSIAGGGDCGWVTMTPIGSPLLLKQD